MGCIARSVAVAGFCVARTVSCGFPIAGRTDILPNPRVGDTAFRGRRRILRDDTSGRRSASIFVDPEDEFPGLDLFTDEIGGDERESLAFINRGGRTIDASAEAETGEFGGPAFQVGEVSAGQTATLLHVQKDD